MPRHETAASPQGAVSSSGLLGAELIRAERERQMQAEGWSEEHDDGHGLRELARAAAAYLKHYIARQWIINDDLGLGISDGLARYQTEPPPDDWPEEWEAGWWKPKDALKDLIRAGALIAAEIDRLNRERRKAPNSVLNEQGSDN